MTSQKGLFFATYTGAEVFDSSAVTASAYTVASGSTLTENTLVFGRGFGVAANNGLKEVDTGATATSIPVTGLATEATAPDNAEVVVAGFRTAAGDLDITDVSGTQVTITSAASVFDDPGLNLHPGMAIYFGGEAALNKFSGTTNVGYAHIVSIATGGGEIVIDNTDALWTTETNTAQEVDFYIGRFLRNVATDDADFLERSFQFELEYPNLNNPSGNRYEYARGNFCNTLAFNMPLTDKATFSAAFVGTDTEPPTTTRATNAATPLTPVLTSAFNTSSDFARLRITQVDETGLTTDFKSVTLTLNNNVSPEKVLANLGARFMNTGNFEVNLEAQLLFTDAAVAEAVRNNTTVRMNFVITNDDGALYIDIPSMTLGGGDREFPINETVLINLTGEAFADPILDTSLGMTDFAFIPSS